MEDFLPRVKIFLRKMYGFFPSAKDFLPNMANFVQKSRTYWFYRHYCMILWHIFTCYCCKWPRTFWQDKKPQVLRNRKMKSGCKTAVLHRRLSAVLQSFNCKSIQQMVTSSWMKLPAKQLISSTCNSITMRGDFHQLQALYFCEYHYWSKSYWCKISRIIQSYDWWGFGVKVSRTKQKTEESK